MVFKFVLKFRPTVFKFSNNLVLINILGNSIVLLITKIKGSYLNTLRSYLILDALLVLKFLY